MIMMRKHKGKLYMIIYNYLKLIKLCDNVITYNLMIKYVIIFNSNVVF